MVWLKYPRFLILSLPAKYKESRILSLGVMLDMTISKYTPNDSKSSIDWLFTAVYEVDEAKGGRKRPKGSKEG